MIQNWLIYTLTALIFYGLWAFFPKLASLYLPARDVIIYQIIGINTIGLILLLTSKVKVQANLSGIVFAVLGGTTGIIGTFFLVKAFAHGKTYVVVTLTALYPIITIILAFLVLKESFSLKNLIGIVFALIAVYLFVSP